MKRSKRYVSKCGEITVRGNAQQMVERYEKLASDEKDTATKEMYLQHADHYRRLI